MVGYGLGWGIVGVEGYPHALLGHSGTHGVDLEWMLLLPEKRMALLLLTNAGGEQALAAFREALGLFLARLDASENPR